MKSTLFTRSAMTLFTMAFLATARSQGFAPKGVPASFDCAMRQAAYSYGQKLLPRKGDFKDLYFALDLNDPSCPTPLAAPSAPARRATQSTQLPAGAVFVAPSGDDGAAGSEAAPLRSIQAACDLAARTSRVVVLRGGTHFLASTITLTAAHSHLRIMPYPGETPVVSGGKELQVAWEAHDVANGKNIWKADISGQVADVPGLQLDGVRATRARYPNLPGGIEVSPGYDAMISEKDATWTPPQFDRFGNVTFFTDARPDTLRNVTPDDWFQRYMIGVGGLCSVYDPPVSYWCSEHPSGGGAFAFRTPSGVTPKAGILPNAPYKDVSRAILNVWRPNRWANWMFEVGGYNATTNNFTFGKGGFQGARGNDNGGDWFIENVFEELDNPGEFFFDADAGELYLYHNGTGAPPKSASVVAPQLKVLLNMSGTQWAPVRNVSVTGITYTAAAYTYMEPHGVPSAGDWALERFASVYLYGTEGVTFDGCTFARIDGNGVMLSGYNRNATVSGSDFEYVGGNAVAAWGFTNETDTDPARPGVAIANAPHAGVDGTDGEHPRYTTVTGCVAREVGLYEKQSSFFVQAKTAQSTITGNVFFNGPRAGINANDGFGGGDVISHNLVFSTCRESGDHGPFNSWDRQPFLTTVRDGTPSMLMAWREIHHNFFIDNYSPQENVDNDDGSAYFKTHDNFLVYGGNGMKNDFGGHDNHHYDNIYAYAGHGLGVCAALDGHEDYFYGNHVVLTGGDVGGFACDGPGKTVLHDNAYYTKDGKITECKMDLAAWQAKGEDSGSTVATWPKDADVIKMAKAKLGF